MDLLEFKKNFTTQGIHMNNAGLAPISAKARDRIHYWADRFYKEGFYTDHDYMEDVLSSRLELSKILNCDVFEIAFFQSTASAISQIAFHLELNENDEVITWDQEYASNLYPWQEACKRKKANLVLVSSGENLQTPFEKIISSINEKTKVIAISWVQFQTGSITELEEIGRVCEEKNIFFMVDVMQGLGLFPFDMKKFKVSAAVGGSHKWLVSPVGVGFLALDSKWTSKIKPHNVGAYTFGTCDDPTDLFCEPKKNALKFEAGSKQVLEITALGASLKLINNFGVENIEQEVVRLSKSLRKGLLEIGATIHSPFIFENHRSAIVNFTLQSEDLKKVASKLPCLYAIRGPGIRLSPHIFNTDEQINQVISSLK